MLLERFFLHYITPYRLGIGVEVPGINKSEKNNDLIFL
jgi:hypothetical protein